MRSEGRGHRIKFLSQVVSDKTLGGWCRYGHTPTGAFHPCPSQTTPPSSGTQTRVWSQRPPSLPPPQTQGRAQVPQSHNPPRPILPIDGLTDPFGTCTNCTHPSEVLSLSPDGVGGQIAAAGTVQGWVAVKAHLGPAFLVCQGGWWLGRGAVLPEQVCSCLCVYRQERPALNPPETEPQEPASRHTSSALTSLPPTSNPR